jgi:hypothetical protein
MNYNLQTIQTAFSSLIKFKRDYVYNSLLGNIDSDLLGDSDSGKYFNVGVNSIITLRNIENLMPLSGDIEVPAWSGTTTYGIDECVSSGDSYYRSIVSSNLNNAVNLTDYWSETTLMSIWLREKIKGVYETVLSKSIMANKLFEHIRMYKNADDNDMIANNSNYVGFELRPKNSEHLMLIINRIATQFSADIDSLSLKLYKQNTLAYTISLSSLVAGEFSFTNITDEEITEEGRWFLFYDQDDLGDTQAYNWTVYASNGFVDILPFEVVNTTTDFVNDIEAYTFNSYGLGLDISIYGNLTNFIVDNKQVFAEAIHLQWQVNILEQFLLNPDIKINGTQRNIEDLKDYIIGELKSETRHSVASKLDKAYKILNSSLESNDIALPGDNEQTVTFNTYG